MTDIFRIVVWMIVIFGFGMVAYDVLTAFSKLLAM
jgi:hypothetical protein